MNVAFHYFLICILIPRLYYQWQDEKIIKLKTHIKILLIESVLMLPLITLNSIIIISGLVIIYHFIVFLLERNSKNIFIRRVLEILLIVILSSFVFGGILRDIEINSVSLKVFNVIICNNTVLNNIDIELMKNSILYLFGILMLINEWNNFIRYILGLIKTEPREKDNPETDKRELGKGKIIGIIERILFFFFVVTGNYASIGFILTAKGITRFKNLDDRDFAEYVLIGTLLSSTISIFWAYIIKHSIISI